MKLRRPVLITLASATFLVTLNAASLPIPLPAILEDLGGTLDEATWVLAAFILAFAVFLLPFARIGETFGRRRLFLLGGAVFSFSALACALAPSIEFLIGAQVFLGVGAAMMESTALALIATASPADERSRVENARTAGLFLAAALGPILSGLITTALSWEYIFVLNLLIGTAVVAGASVVFPTSRIEVDTTPGCDLLGLALGATGIFLLAFTLVDGARLGWGSPLILGAFAASLVALTLFVRVERRAKAPLIEPALFKDRLFAVGSFLRAVTEFTSLGVFFTLSHFLQVQLGHSALVAGLLLMSVIAGAGIVAPLTEASVGRIDVRWSVVPGFLVVAVGTFWVSHVSLQTGWAFFIAPLAIIGVGLGALEAPTERAMQRNVPRSLSGMAALASYTTYLLGIGLGVAVVSAVWQTQFVANANDVLSTTNLPPAIVNDVSSSLLRNGVSGDPGALMRGPEQMRSLIQGAFVDAVGTALLSCVVVALLAAGAAAFFASNRTTSRLDA